MARLRYSLHAGAWTKHWTESSFSLIDKAKSLGFEELVVPLILDEIDTIEAAGSRSHGEAVGLSLSASTACTEPTDISSFDEGARIEGIAFLKQCVEATADLGSTCLTGVLHSANYPDRSHERSTHHLERSAEALKEVARHAQDFGVTLALKPLDVQSNLLINSLAQAKELQMMIDEENVAFQFDTYYVFNQEPSIYKTFKASASELCHVSLNESNRGVPGTGDIDWSRLLAILSNSGYRGTLSIHPGFDPDLWEAAASTRDKTAVDAIDDFLRQALSYCRSCEAPANNR